MSRAYDQWDMDRPIAAGAIDRFLSLQQRIEAVLNDRLAPWYEAEHAGSVPYGARLKSIEHDGLHFEVWPHYDDRPRGSFIVPFSILTDQDFEATCARKLSARTAANESRKALEAKTERAAADRRKRGAETRDRATYERLRARFEADQGSAGKEASHVR